MSSRAMRNTLFLVGGLLIYQDLVIRRLNKRLRRGREQFYKLHEVTDYFLNIINENNIELTEFDVIALTSITEDE